MLEAVANHAGASFDEEGYIDQFYKDCVGIDLLWKFERQQWFREPDVPSWVAFEEGDVNRSLQLAEEARPGIQQAVAAKPFETRRVRVVEEPLTPYLWWEFQLLVMRCEAGDHMVVTGPESITKFEETQPLPEVVGLGTDVLWQVLYDEDGICSGARRITERDFIRECRNEFQSLFSAGEDLLSYYARVVQPMQGPRIITEPSAARF